MSIQWWPDYDMTESQKKEYFEDLKNAKTQYEKDMFNKKWEGNIKKN